MTGLSKVSNGSWTLPKVASARAHRIIAWGGKDRSRRPWRLGGNFDKQPLLLRFSPAGQDTVFDVRAVFRQVTHFSAIGTESPCRGLRHGETAKKASWMRHPAGCCWPGEDPAGELVKV